MVCINWNKKIIKLVLHHRGIEPGSPVWQSREETFRPRRLNFLIGIFYAIYNKYELFQILSPSLFPFAHGGNSIKKILCYLHVPKDQLEQRNHPYSILDTWSKYESEAYYTANVLYVVFTDVRLWPKSTNNTKWF